MESLLPLRFALKLRVYRRMKGLSLSRMAEKSGLTTDRYEDLESGQHEPRAGDMFKVANNNGLTFDGEDFTERGLKI